LALFILFSFSKASVSEPVACETAVVGGGWAGLYAAWRLTIDTHTVEPSRLCLFEARSTVGGRTYTVEVERLKLDIGAYRFGQNQHLPGDLIVNRFNMSTACYEPDCALDPEMNQTLHKIVDEEGQNAGYSTPLFRMLSDMTSAGVCVFYRHMLTGVYSDEALPGMSQLHFAGGEIASAKKVLLNLPRNAIELLDPMSSVFPALDKLGFTLLRNCTPCSVPGGPAALSVEMAVKAYAIYEDPWWLTKLNLTHGYFTSVDTDPPLVGRYHDGPVRRSASGEAIGPGALEAVYSYTRPTPMISYYKPFAPKMVVDPLSITTDPALLGPLHHKLMDFHSAAFAARGINSSAVPQMKHVILGVWTNDKLSTLLPTPQASNFYAQLGDVCPSEQCLRGVSPDAYYDAVETPNEGVDIHVANNDFSWALYQSVPCCWAENSLKAVERTLHREWGLAKPEWLDSAYYAKIVGLESTVVI